MNRANGFFRRLIGLFRANVAHRDLVTILTNADDKASHLLRTHWAKGLVAWLREGGPQRLKFLLQMLERDPKAAARVGEIITSLLAETQSTAFFAQTELSEQRGFFSEMGRRLASHVTPARARPGELGYLVEKIFTDNWDPEWFDSLDEETWLSLLSLLAQSPSWKASALSLRRGLHESLLSLSVQAAALGLTAEVRERDHSSEWTDQPSTFTMLNRAAVRWYEAGSEQATEELLAALSTCLDVVNEIHRGTETEGVSLVLVYRLETIRGLLGRMELLLRGSPRKIASEMLRSLLGRKSVRRLFELNLDLFAHKLIEHAGETGEHYITRTRSEYFAMFRSGAGGGLVMVPATMIKFALGVLNSPPFFEGLFVWLNYSVAFLGMQFAGFALATKQPSMTAAALAGRLSRRMVRSQLSEFVEEVARISRSQFIAAVGNVGFVMPGALVASFIWSVFSPSPILGEAYALKTLHSLHPWKSPALLYAALTGVLLWLSSLGAGWLQNWVIFSRLPETLLSNGAMLALFGEARTRKIGDWLQRHAAGLGGNVSIAFLLAFVPVMGKFFGIALDIRHVTLSAGAAVFSFLSLGDQVTLELFATTALGIAGIGVLNFAVSTALALAIAMRARRVRRAWARAVLAETWRGFVAHPLRFLLPPRE